MKVGIIRCRQTEDACAGTTDFISIRQKTGAFSGAEGDIEIIGIVSCGGCPGKKAIFRAKSMVRRGADTIAFASCIGKGTPIGFACPFARQMMDTVRAQVGGDIKILEYTH